MDVHREKAIEVETPRACEPEPVTAFKISPDGTRMALVRATATGSELGLAKIIRSQDKITVNGWRPLNTAQTAMPPIRTIADVAWRDATELLVLGAADPASAYAPYRVVEDASRITAEGEPQNWEADRARGTSRHADRNHRWPQGLHLEGRRQSMAALLRQDQDQHHRLSRLRGHHLRSDCPQIAERQPILKLARVRLGRWALSIGWRQRVTCCSAPAATAAESLGGGSARSVVSRSPADVLFSRLQFPAPMDSRSR